MHTQACQTQCMGLYINIVYTYNILIKKKYNYYIPSRATIVKQDTQTFLLLDKVLALRGTEPV